MAIRNIEFRFHYAVCIRVQLRRINTFLYEIIIVWNFTFRAFMDLLSSDQREMLTENLRNYLNSVVQNIDDADRVIEIP